MMWTSLQPLQGHLTEKGRDSKPTDGARFGPRFTAATLRTWYKHKPGKPTILASYREKPFIGFPGFPVSTWVVAKFVLDSLVESYYGLLPQCWQQGKALSGRKIPSEGGSIEFVRGVVGAASSQKGLVFMPLNRGAGAMSSVVRANAVLTIPAILKVSLKE